MKNKLSCALVRDLLPTYVDGLTSEETNNAVEEHLSDCENCTEVLNKMKTPEDVCTSPAEVDYLKKVRRHGVRRSLIVGIVLMLTGMALISFRFFYIGYNSDNIEAYYDIEVTDNVLNFSGAVDDRNLAVSRVTFSDSNGMVCATIYTAPKVFFNSNEFHATYTAGSAVAQVRIDDLIIWQDGVEIERTASQLFAATNPYIGDMPSNTRIASIVGVPDQFGTYSNKLQTATEPYGWTLVLDTEIASDDENTAKGIMTADSYAMLATIGNLGYVTWQYHTESGNSEHTVTAEEATAFAGHDIKECIDSVTSLQKLIQSLSIKWSGVRGETLQESGKFTVIVRNNCDEKIYGLMLNYYINGELIGSTTTANANETAWKKGDSFEFEFLSSDFPDGTSALDITNMSIDLLTVDKDGSEKTICKDVKLSAKYAWHYFFTLNSNSSGELVLNEG